MLPSYFDYIFVHLKQKVRLRPKLTPKLLSTLGPDPTLKARPGLQLCRGQHYFLIVRKGKTLNKKSLKLLACKFVSFPYLKNIM